MGKLKNQDLSNLLNLIKKNPKVIVPPLPGFDAGVHIIDDKYMVVSTDPCIGVPQEWFGWLLINYASSDTALFGAKPEFCTINLLGPSSTDPKIFYKIMKQACSAANELNLAIVTGHTGTYDGLSTILGVCTVYGMVDKDQLITPKGAKPGDLILATKPIGLEIIINFSLLHRSLAIKLFGVNRTNSLSNLVYMQSCVKEALLLAETGKINSMHDITEGGLIIALNEIAEAANVGFKIDYNKIPIPKEVYILKKSFNMSYEQILAMSSTGTILISINPQTKNIIDDTLLKNGLKPYYIGSFTKNLQRILLKNGKEVLFPKTANDPYHSILLGKTVDRTIPE